MNEQTQHGEPRGGYSVQISGGVSGSQIAVGSQITQTQTVVPVEVIGEQGMAELAAQITEIRRKVETEAPPEQRADALANVAAIEESLTAGAPQLSRLAKARTWFANNLPTVAGAVTSLIVHPLVGRLVEAAGDALVAEFRQLFAAEPGGQPPTK